MQLYSSLDWAFYVLCMQRQSDWYLTCPKCCRVHTKVSVYQLPVNEELKAALEGGTEANSIRAYKRMYSRTPSCCVPVN